MVCKNCGKTLRTDYSYCPNCGAKVIRNRITFKNLWFDVYERYFNLDNTFIRTLKDMVLKPKEVCLSYIKGTRKKYLNPISLLAISLTLSGFILFILKNIAWETIDFSSIEFSGNQSSEKILAITMEYSSLLFLFYIPLLAICGYLLFNDKNLNLPEHLITALYALGAFSVLTFPYSFITLIISPQTYINMSLWYSVAMIVFCLYVFYRITNQPLKSLLWRAPVFTLLFIIGFFGVSIVFNVILLLTGTLSLADFAPNK